MSEQAETSGDTTNRVIRFESFLESTPPGQEVTVSGIWEGSLNSADLETPEIRLHCSHDLCGGTRVFRCTSSRRGLQRSFANYFLDYVCSNCQKSKKTFSIALSWHASEHGLVDLGTAVKYGEIPTFGPPTPSRLIQLIGPDRDLFLKGRRCENQSLGIAAFVYYRRVVEDQKTRIIGEILRVSQKIGAGEAALEQLRAAKDETQFTKALELAKPALPQSLMINGHNPLGLLHSALSEGLHALSDEECLKIAGSVRVVLVELSERLGQALKDEAELTNAIGTLLNRKPKDA